MTVTCVRLHAVGLVPSGAFPLAVAAMVLARFMNPFANGSLLALVQAIVPPEMQGRILTLIQSGTGLAIPPSLAIAGPLADALGVGIWLVPGCRPRRTDSRVQYRARGR